MIGEAIMGWDQHPEYGGPEPTWRDAILRGVTLIGGLIALALLWHALV